MIERPYFLMLWMVGILINGVWTRELMFVINTWPFTAATDAGFESLLQGGSSLDAVIAGCSQCETDQCDGTVGWGGSPDEDGHTTLDALVMEGGRQDTGAVIQLKSVREASKVARAVLEHTYHSVLVGENATNFALSLGFKSQPLSSQRSINIWEDWKKANCQPNYWKNMVNSTTKCGPYIPNLLTDDHHYRKSSINRRNHDTIGIITLDRHGKMAAGTTTNGMNHKIPGRSSDSALPGCGAFVDESVGGAVATGDGDIMMRFSPAFLAVELMRGGMSPKRAAEESITRISTKYPNSLSGAVIAANKDGKYGAACYGMDKFPYSVRDSQDSAKTRVVEVDCLS
ncbi:N(4)-(Beta-N-acetylglucosaminyl)-L-asparaginase-like isoform X2 [Bolinopsis microptera]|uniref:N(4)-(Beta-N-acetylglucosaminyl)-L-asparaginase- like isoform X2 n=1 Tax=Bolinopsis microptera TaxID=2820187 RepID=UPI003079DAC2